MKRESMQLGQTTGPLVIAPVGSMVVSVLVSMLDGRGAVASITTAWLVGFISLAAGFILVLPVLWLAPRLRHPPLWLAAIWGCSSRGAW
jgi:tellurite resistance protein TehA-like permease